MGSIVSTILSWAASPGGIHLVRHGVGAAAGAARAPVQGAAMAESSLPGEFGIFLNHNKKWWVLPILVIFLCFAAILVLGSTAAAPFNYALF
jgi:hypothetical protein